MKNNISLGAAVITQNHENYIESAIEALLDQTHNISNIMIVDDNSEDSTYSKVEKYSRRYSFIGCKKNPEVLGPSKSSNLALNFLQNEFILFTSGDDISYRDRAHIQLEYFKKNSKLTCVINSVNVFSDDKSVNLSNIPKFSHSNVTGSELFKEMFWKI
jgi:glycosyltransferase involved in cell wall biosynthesis